MHPYIENMLRKGDISLRVSNILWKDLYKLKKGHTKSIGNIHEVIRIFNSRTTTLSYSNKHAYHVIRRIVKETIPSSHHHN